MSGWRGGCKVSPTPLNIPGASWKCKSITQSPVCLGTCNHMCPKHREQLMANSHNECLICSFWQEAGSLVAKSCIKWILRGWDGVYGNVTALTIGALNNKFKIILIKTTIIKWFLEGTRSEKKRGWLDWRVSCPLWDLPGHFLPGALRITFLEVDHSTLINTFSYSIQSLHSSFLFSRL